MAGCFLIAALAEGISELETAGLLVLGLSKATRSSVQRILIPR